MKELKQDAWLPETALLSDECMDLLLDEAERSILAVDARFDHPGARTVHGDAEQEWDSTAEGVSEFRLAIAQMVDACPAVQSDLESAGDRLRNIGLSACLSELETNPQVLQLLRLSLEVLLRRFPTVETFTSARHAWEADDLEHVPDEVYAAYAQLSGALRDRLS